MASQREQEGEDDELTDAELVDLLRHPEVYGYGCEDEGDWAHPDDTHADPNKYTDDQILAMDEALAAGGLTTCTLHVDHRYPIQPVGVWSPQVDVALDWLAQATAAHGGDTDGPYLATPDELRQLWNDQPHARWWIEEQGDAGSIKIDLVNA